MITTEARCATIVTAVENHNLLDPMLVGMRKYPRADANTSTMTA